MQAITRRICLVEFPFRVRKIHLSIIQHDASRPFNEKLMTKISEPAKTSGNKISVIAVGNVGIATVVTLLYQSVSHEIAMVDIGKNKLEGEFLDLEHGSVFMGSPNIESSTDLSVTKDSKICVVTAGVRQKQGQSRLELVQDNVNLFKTLIPKLATLSPDAVLLIVTNPVDILTHVASLYSGLSREKVIGSGTNLDSSRFKYFISEYLKISVSSVHGWIIGEHGDSSVPVWSGVNVAGVKLQDLNPHIGTASDEAFKDIHKKVIKAADEIIQRKGYTSWAVGLSVATICRAILHNTHSVHAVSTHALGFHGITQDVCLSLPVVLGENGVSHVIKQNLNATELSMLHESAAQLDNVIKHLK